MRRLLWLLLMGLAIVVWVEGMAPPLIDGYGNSSEVLDKRARVAALDRQVSDLRDEVAYAGTVEGRDVEAKRQFGVGPSEDVLINVHVAAAADQEAQPVGLGDRAGSAIQRGLQTVRSSVNRWVELGSYWAGRRPLPPPPGTAKPEPEEAE